MRLILSISISLALSINAWSAELEVVTENLPPWQYLANGKPSGYATNIVEKVLNHANIPYTITFYPWSRAYRSSLSKKNILIYTIYRVPDRENKFKWVKPLGAEETEFLWTLRANDHINPKSLEETKNLSLALHKDNASYNWFINNKFNHIYKTSIQDLSVDMLLAKRVEIISGTELNISSRLSKRRLPIKTLKKVFPIYKAIPYMALSLPTSNEILFRLQSSYDKLIQEGKISIGKVD